MHKANRGEWSELYVFLYALATGKIFAADEHLSRIEDTYYQIISAIKQVDTQRKEYRRNPEQQVVILFDNTEQKIQIPISDFVNNASLLLQSIKNSSGRTFNIPSIESFLTQIDIDTIKAGSGSKKDVTFQIHDAITNTNPEIGFSVKSYIGNNPTLLNSSGATVFTYLADAVIPKELVEQANTIQTRTKVKDRLQLIKEHGYKLQFHELSSPVFLRNLQLIDYQMPMILADLCKYSYFVSGKRMKDVVQYYCEQENIDDIELIEYKVKNLLVASALGMEPDTRWNGMEDANGGYIVVKSDGDVLCYHIYERNRLRDYLYNATKFDTPSTSRTGTGAFIHDPDSEQVVFKLSLQIRF